MVRGRHAFRVFEAAITFDLVVSGLVPEELG
jgi:hypothetical protein